MAGKALTITYLADAKSVLAAQGQIDRGNTSLQGTTGKTGGIFSTTFGSLMPIAAAAAGAAVLKFGVDSVKAFAESEQIMAQTEQRLKTTGGAANVTADDVVGLSGRLRDLSGVDDEVIQSSENLLLTFTNVRNEVGKGNDIFDQTTEAVLDLATGMNNGAIPSAEQMTNATKLLGRAVNAPEEAFGRLARAGIFLTDKQKEVITSSAAVGDTLTAQKTILDAVAVRYGGAAEAAGDTFAGKLEILKSKLGDVQEEVGGALVPALEALLDTLIALTPAFKLVGVAIESLPIVQTGEDIQQLKVRQEQGTSSWRDYADVILDSVPVLGHFVDLAGDTTDVLDTQHGIVGDLADFYQAKYQQALAGASDEQSNLEKATEAATQAQREQKLVILGLTDDFLGIVDAGNQVAEAQKEVNRLQDKGKEDTKAYDDAVLELLESQLGLEEAVISYGKELVDEGKSQEQVEKKIRDAAEAAGLNKGEVRELIGTIQDYIDKVNAVPKTKHTTLILGIQTDVGNTPSEIRAALGLQHGGIVTRPTFALIGEAGPEAVVPLNRAGGAGIGGVTIVNNGVIAGPGGIEELADMIRREIVKTSSRNVTSGIT